MSYTTTSCTFCPWAFVPVTVTVRDLPSGANNDVVGRQHLALGESAPSRVAVYAICTVCPLAFTWSMTAVTPLPLNVY